MSTDRTALRRLGRRTTNPRTAETLPSLVGHWRVERDVELVQRSVPVSPLRDAVLALVDQPPPVPSGTPHLTPREVVVVQWLLDLLTKHGVHVPPMGTPEREAAHATGWGMPCSGGDHTHGCPVAGGYERVALARLWSYANPEPVDLDPLTQPDQRHPFERGGLFGPLPPCYSRFVRGWHHLDLPPS